MNKVKMFLVYGSIIVLCIAALAGYFASSRQKNDTAKGTQAASASAQSETDAAVQSEAAAPAPSEEKPSDQAIDIPQKIMEKMKKTSEAPDPNPVVGIGQGTDFAKVTRESIKNAGGLEGVIKKGDTVLIKPNMIKAATPDKGIVTDYRVVQEIVNIARECGASRVIVADGSPWNKSFDGEAEAYKGIKDAELLDFNDCKEEDCYKLKPANGASNSGFFIPKIYMEADVVISAAKLKTHAEAVVTLSLKNAFGVPPMNVYASGFAGKTYLHSLGIDKSIVDLNLIRKPDFAVIDGIIGGEGNMPISGTPIDSKVVFAGRDPVASDTAALNFMGFTIENVPHVKLAGEKGLGINDLGRIKIVGAELEKIKMVFKISEHY